MSVIEQTDPVRDPNVPPKLHVLFPTGNRVDYEITNDSTVSDLVKLIEDDKSVQKPENRIISLIYHGKILPPTDVLSKIDTMPEFTVHVFFRQTPNRKRSHKHKNEQQNNEASQTTEENHETNNDETANNDDDLDLRGFDRLSRMNYTPEQISEIRRTFHTMQGSLNSSHEDQINAEEEWFPVIFNTNVVDGGAAGAARVLLGIGANVDTPLNRNRRPRNNEAGQENDDDYDDQESREYDQENPDNRDRGIRGWAIFNGGDARPDDENDTSSWLRFLFGFIIGIIFGIGSILFMLTALNDRSMLAGLFVGTLSHYCFSRFLDSLS